jgi:hypothetical protein
MVAEKTVVVKMVVNVVVVEVLTLKRKRSSGW